MNRKTHLQTYRAQVRTLLKKVDGRTIGLAWYTRESWQRLVEVADDRETLHASFEDWKRQAVATALQLAGAGADYRKVYLDVDALVTWCRERGRPVNSAARAAYTSQRLQQGGGARDVDAS